MTRDNKALGVIHLKHIVKGGMKERFAHLRKMGIKTVMITGDNPLTAAAIAAEAGVDDFLAQATPEAKLKLIREYQTGGRLVAMTGDGTNDAPALAQADVAVAMNTGTQPAREAANMVDLDSNPTKLIEIVEAGIAADPNEIFIESVYEETVVEAVRPNYSRVERDESEYTRRLNSVLDGADNFTSFESAGEWGSRRHSRVTERRARVREYVSGLMYEEMPQPDVDFYDQAPIALSSTPVQQVSAQEAAPAQDSNDGLKASRRLKTDIRSSQPSLSYALKKIEKSQLP